MVKNTKNISIETNILPSEKWEEVIKSNISSTTINSDVHYQITNHRII